MLINISDIQHFSVGDGPGIRSTVFFKGCNLRCPWCHNPETISPAPQELFYHNTGRREKRGSKVEPCEILQELVSDKNYYDESGGGVTLSGGEVLLQAAGAAELATLLRAEGISVAVDTAGCVPYAVFEKLRGLADLYLYDFKTGSAGKYRQIGGDLLLIRDNLARLLASGTMVRVRIPLIPGFNTDSQSIREICGHLTEIGISAVDLLPFHRLGSSKYAALGLEYAYSGTEPLTKEELGRIKSEYAQHFAVTMEV